MTTSDENSKDDTQQWMDMIAKGQKPLSPKDEIQQWMDMIAKGQKPLFGLTYTKKSAALPLDILTIAASIASVTQAVLMVADMWTRRAKGKSIIKAKNAYEGWNEVKEIHVLMTDGNRIQFNSWLTEPSRVKDFLNAFRSSSATPKPVSVRFILDNDSKVQMNVSGTQNDDHLLEMFIRQLKSNDN